MKNVRVTITAAACLSLGTLAPVYAQHEAQGDKPAAKQEEKQSHTGKPSPMQEKSAPPHAQKTKQQAPQPRAQQPKPVERAQQAQPQSKPQPHAAQVQQARQQPQRTEQQARTWQQNKGWQQPGVWQAHASWQQDRSSNWSSDHRTWAQRGGYGGYYIPQDSYNRSFGSQHSFRLGSQPVMYLGYPRFEYGGFSFLLVDPWPEAWAMNWYASDDVYIDYDNGYYLCDTRYPQMRLAITVEL